ncbi:hypothetical protein GIB67_017695 [Kingdonia uniflora]|uniref:Uncharacterized protein n=1 Tax=Kingdonia uniflora TaxID=39325 RepID=A0A7J7NA55_9MAGN|nr:hypothetical protein GIB67_017695 [Kingdonia uniflora]
MYKGDSGNPIFPLFNEGNRFQYDPNTPTQLQLFGNYAAGCSVDPVNYVGNERVSSLTRPGRQGRDLEDISRQQKLQISLNNNFYQEAADRMAVIPPNPLLTGPPNPVSTGLRLSYDDDERNSAVTSASGSMSTALPAIFSLGDNLRIEINRQKEEFDNYIRVQLPVMNA